MKDVSQEFNPFLSITPIQWRRMYISDVFAERIKTASSFEDFISDVSDFLNVTPRVMKDHYARASKFTENINTQNSLIKDAVEAIQGAIS